MSNPVFRLISALILLCLLAACATNPVTGSRNFALSEDWELSAGKEYHQQILKQYSVYPDEELQRYLDDIGQRLAKTSHRPDLPFTFTLLDSPEVNAFALPGGYVYITRGIMAYMTEEAHLAGVIGHEIGHITALHGAQRAAHRQLAGIATIGAAILTGNADVAQLSQMLGGALMSGYGRNQELESDRLGAEYIAKNDYDVNDMIGVIGILKDQEQFAAAKAQREGRPVQAYHGLFSTHPKNDKRLREVIKAAEKFQNPNATKDDGGRFLRLTDGMSFGESEEQGITRGNKFYHKSLDLYVEFPQGWRIQNLPTMLNAISPDGSQLVRVQMDQIGKNQTIDNYLASKFSRLQSTRYIDSSFGRAFSGLATVTDGQSGQSQNVLVSAIKRGDQAFIVAGLGRNDLPNAALVSVTKKMRALKRSERPLAEGREIKLIRAKQGDTFAALARRSNLDDYAEDQLRLINGMYPSGEPRAGQMIKLIK